MPYLAKSRRKYRKLKSNKAKKLSFLFIFVCLIMLFLIVINFADIFSSLITHKGSLFTVNKIETASYSVYGVSIKDYDNEEDATKFANSVSQKGGAGYIYHSGEYFVLGNVYQSLNEATEIKENLLELGYNSRIVNIKVDATCKTYRGNNMKVLLACLNWFRNCYNSLYEEGLNFDKNLSNRNQTNSCLANVLTSLSQLNQELNKLKGSHDKEVKNLILPHFKQCKELLEDLLYSKDENTIFSSKMKCVSVQIVLHNKQIVKNLNEI